MINFYLVTVLILIGLQTVAVIFLLLFQIVPYYKLGIPFDFRNSRAVFFIYLNLNRFEHLQGNYYRMNKEGKNYILSFMPSWMFHLYEGRTVEEIQCKTDIGGQSNRASYLTFWEKYLGKKIENFYLQDQDRVIGEKV